MGFNSAFKELMQLKAENIKYYTGCTPAFIIQNASTIFFTEFHLFFYGVSG